MGCCISNINGLPSGGSSPSASIITSEFRFDQQGTIVLANGAQNITDTSGRTLATTIANVGAAATYRFLSGTGLQFVANATNSQYTSGALTASSLEMSVQDIYNLYGVDASWDMYVRIRATVLTFPTNNVTNGLVLAIRGAAASPSNSAARMRGIQTGLHAGVRVLDTINDATAGSSYTNAPASTADTFGLLSVPGDIDCLAGVWAGSFPTTQMAAEVTALTGANTNTSGFRNGLNFLGIAFATGNANADMQVTIERMRFDFRAASAAA